MHEGDRPVDARSPSLDVVDTFVGEAAGCLFEALFTGCAPMLLIVVGVMTLKWWV